MSSMNWLRKQVERLETEIREDSIFDNEAAPTREKLQQLREKIVVHTYLKQQLLRREPVRISTANRRLFDTQEFVLART